MTAFPLSTVRSLRPTFVPVRLVGLTVKLPYAYTLDTISTRSEETFVRLRYRLGGDRPSQTARLKLSFDQIMIQS